MSIIGISGKIGSGKDTIAKIIQYLTIAKSSYIKDGHVFNLDNSYEKSPWKIKKMAGKLKQMVSLLTGIPVEDLEKEEVKNRKLGPEWKVFEYTDDEGKTKVRLGDDLIFDNLGTTYTVRQLLQKLGTEALREIIHPNVHINALFADYNKVFTSKSYIKSDGTSSELEFPNWLITDVRFPNEGEAILDRNGILIRTNRWREDHFIYNVKEHPSETSLDNYDKFKYTINNSGTIQDLIERVKEILIAEKII